MPKKSATKPPKMPEKIPQPNGRGALYAGGVPGNKGGTGRPADKVRALALEGANKATPRIIEIALTGSDRDAIAAFDKLTKVGLPLQIEAGENPTAPFLTPQERKERLKALGLDLDQR